MSEAELDARKYAAADKELLELILHESDKRLAAQVQLMLAADQRASGVLAGTISLGAAALGFAVSQVRDGRVDALFWATISMGALEMLAACIALTALWPELVKPQGWSPASFRNDLAKTKVDVQGEIAVHLQGRIEENRRCAARLGRRMKAAMLTAAEGPIVGACLGLASSGRPYAAGAVAAGLVAVGLLIWLGAPLLPGSAARRRAEAGG